MTQQAAELVDLLDSEVDAIQKIWDRLRAKHQKSSRNYEAVEREIKDEFARIGLVASVKWFTYAVNGQRQDGAMPEISVVGRVEKTEFDRDRQVREVTSNILGIPGQEGVIKVDPDTYRRFREGNSGHGGHHH